MEKIGAELESMSSILGSVREVMEASIKTAADLGAVIEKMSEQVSYIETISDSINLLALNAIIRVAHTGEGGKGLGVLAEEIKKISDDAKREISAGTGLIGSIGEQAERLRKGLSEAMGGKLAETDEIRNRLSRAVGELIEADKQLASSIVEISSGTRALMTEIDALVSGMKFNDVIRAMVERAVSDIRTMQREAEKYAASAPSDMGGLTEELRRLAGQYTMQSERDVHDAHVASALGLEPQPGKEAFEASSGKNSDDDLGDNVELF